MHMEKLQQLRDLYEAYIQKTLDLQKNAKPLQGFLGFGQRLGTDPCHGEFAANVENLMQQPDISAEEAAAMVAYAMEEPERHKKNDLAYWMLLAVQGKMISLTGKLTAEDASELLAKYDKLQPKRMRLPIQKDFAKALKKAAK